VLVLQYSRTIRYSMYGNVSITCLSVIANISLKYLADRVEYNGDWCIIFHIDKLDSV